MKYVKLVITFILVLIIGVTIVGLQELIFNRGNSFSLVFLEISSWFIYFLIGFNFLRINRFVWNVEELKLKQK